MNSLSFDNFSSYPVPQTLLIGGQYTGHEMWKSSWGHSLSNQGSSFSFSPNKSTFMCPTPCSPFMFLGISHWIQSLKLLARSYLGEYLPSNCNFPPEVKGPHSWFYHIQRSHIIVIHKWRLLGRKWLVRCGMHYGYRPVASVFLPLASPSICLPFLPLAKTVFDRPHRR